MSQSDFQHIIITRFNLRKSDWKYDKHEREVLNSVWEKDRISLFHKFCLPSVVGQSVKNFKWIIFFHANPGKEIKNLLEQLGKYDFIEPVFVNSFEDFQNDLSGIIRERINTGTGFLLTTRLDNDDAIHHNFVEKLQDTIAGLKNNTLIYFPYGLFLDYGKYSRLGASKYSFNQFLSLFEKVAINSEMKTVLSRAHDAWEDHSVLEIDMQDAWLQVVHEKNMSNTFIGVPVFSNRLKNFRINRVQFKTGYNLRLLKKGFRRRKERLFANFQSSNNSGTEHTVLKRERDPLISACTFVTLLSSPEYFKGVIVLADSLKKVDSKYPFLVLMPFDFKENNDRILQILSNKNIEFKVLEKSFILPERNSKYMHSRRWVHTYDKLQVFGLTQFKKVVFLDSDILVVRNIDHLFDKPHLTFAAASEQVSGCEDWNMPNTGMMVIEPQSGIPEKIFENWREVQSGKTDFGDQDLIHHYFGKKFKNSQEWRIPATNNAFVFLLDKIIKEKGYNLNLRDPNDKTISVLHFAIKDRPWLMNTKDVFLFYLDRVLNRKFQEIRAYRLYFREMSKLKV